MLNYSKKILFKQIDKELDMFYSQTEKLKLAKGFLQSVLYIVSELLTNVKEHSKASHVLLKARINKKNALISIEDNGVGLKKSYNLKKIYPKDDLAAIEFALSGLSTKDSKYRGFGLFSTRKLIEALKGSINIISGQGYCLVERGRISFKISKNKKGLKIEIKAPVKNINFYSIIK